MIWNLAVFSCKNFSTLFLYSTVVQQETFCILGILDILESCIYVLLQNSLPNKVSKVSNLCI